VPTVPDDPPKKRTAGPAVTPEFKASIAALVAQCDSVGKAMRDIAKFLTTWYLRIRNVNFALGAVAAVLEMSVLVEGGGRLGYLPSIASIGAAVVLVVSTAYFGMRGAAMPQLLTMYADDILTFRDRLKAFNENRPTTALTAKLEVYREVAEKNLRDADGEFSFLADYLTASDAIARRSVLRGLLWPTA